MEKDIRRLKLDGFEVSLEYLDPGACQISLKGELDYYIYDRLVDFVMQNLLPTEEAAVIDMHGLDFMNSHGIRFIVKLMYRFGAGNVAIYRISSNIRRMLTTAAIDVNLAEPNDPEELNDWLKSRKKAA